MERGTLIIVVVCAVVGPLLLVVAVWWLRRRLVPSTPFPPVQPLAHHRHHQHLTAPSKVSLLPDSLPPPSPSLQSPSSSDNGHLAVHSLLKPSSSRSTLHSKSSLRGTPHGPHSQIQIILPAPLSQELLPELPSSQRGGVVDSWVTSDMMSY